MSEGRRPVKRARLAHPLVLIAVAVTACAAPVPALTPARAPPATPTPSPTATGPAAVRPAPEYISYVVQSGDTLWDVASRLGTTAEAIMQTSGLTSTTIYSGTRLLIPLREEAVGTPTLMLILLPSPTPGPAMSTARPSPTPTEEMLEVYVGMPVDELLDVWGAPWRITRVGQDAEGMIVEWVYQDAELTLKRWQIGGVCCYRVAEIGPR